MPYLPLQQQVNKKTYNEIHHLITRAILYALVLATNTGAGGVNNS